MAKEEDEGMELDRSSLRGDLVACGVAILIAALVALVVFNG